jgi:hypothetical protein
MKARVGLVFAALSLSLGGFGRANTTVAEALPVEPAVWDPAGASDWICKEEDNVCGISDTAKTSNPAKVDYPTLLDATPQIKEMKRDKIDPNSAEGKSLRKRAATLITKTCEVVRQSKGHCGVWKAIKHKDGRIIADLTDDVKAKF